MPGLPGGDPRASLLGQDPLPDEGPRIQGVSRGSPTRQGQGDLYQKRCGGSSETL